MSTKYINYQHCIFTILSSLFSTAIVFTFLLSYNPLQDFKYYPINTNNTNNTLCHTFDKCKYTMCEAIKSHDAIVVFFPDVYPTCQLIHYSPIIIGGFWLSVLLIITQFLIGYFCQNIKYPAILTSGLLLFQQMLNITLVLTLPLSNNSIQSVLSVGISIFFIIILTIKGCLFSMCLSDTI